MTQPLRRYSAFDNFCLRIDQKLRQFTQTTPIVERAYPAATLADATLTERERQHAAGLMRINHAGEIAAQALYEAQSFFARDKNVCIHLQTAAAEEGDHLTWCKQRLFELSSHTSYLQPLWYGGSFVIGLVAGLAGDKWSLGFVAETELQVVHHLEKHLQLLPPQDVKSQKVLQQMLQDEAHHRDEAIANGAAKLPQFIKTAMRFTAKIMVKIAYWL